MLAPALLFCVCCCLCVNCDNIKQNFFFSYSHSTHTHHRPNSKQTRNYNFLFLSLLFIFFCPRAVSLRSLYTKKPKRKRKKKQRKFSVFSTQHKIEKYKHNDCDRFRLFLFFSSLESEIVRFKFKFSSYTFIISFFLHIIHIICI